MSIDPCAAHRSSGAESRHAKIALGRAGCMVGALDELREIAAVAAR